MRPHFAPPDGYTGTRRALLLAGGGMRVSWQAGVLRALSEHGLVFTHGDGTSGGIMNLAAILSGVTPEDLCDRWRRLEPRQFSSLMPLGEYFRPGGPMALGNAHGVLTEVFPRLGIDLEQIHAAQGVAGAFNVCNFNRKAVEAVPHERVQQGHLVAGMSLPIFMPPVLVDGVTYTDAVWIKDANLIDAVRRGAQELWLVWCIGNTPTYKGGVFDQYVHMIEMSANGALSEEFDRIREINERIRGGEPVYGHTRPITLHVIRPEYPLPLDPDYFFGNISASELIDLGYAAARHYLDQQRSEGVPFEPETMIMQEPASPGISFSEVMKGGLALGATDPGAGAKEGEKAGQEFIMRATVTVRDLDRFVVDPDHKGSLRATVDFGPLGNGIPSGEGTFQLFATRDTPSTKLMVYEFPFEHGGKKYYFAGRKEVRDDPGFDLWKDTTTLLVQLHQGTDRSGAVVGAGTLTLGAADFAKVLANVSVIDSDSATEKVKTIAKFGQFFAGELWKSYGPKAG